MIPPAGAARWITGGLAALVVLAGWALHEHRPPFAARAQAMNKGRSWQFKTRTDSKGVQQVWVPPGCFEMGSSLWEDVSARADESPRHTVCISAGFWLDRFEVTNESFMRFAREGGYDERRYWSEEGWREHQGRPNPHWMPKQFNSPGQPRVKISWYEAEAYAAWRGGRLPTEAQWEWAARGPDSRRYPWGHRFMDGVANMAALGLRCTRPVGSYPGGRSWCGAEDMAGNVSEWVADGYSPGAYAQAPLADPYTAPTGHVRVVRGGAWGGITGGSAADLRSARRVGFGAGHRKGSLGMRVMHFGP